MKIIKDELDQDQDSNDEIEAYYQKLEELELPEKVEEKIEEEIKN